MASRADRSLVVSVQHFCLHDGPGIRSVVFFKGCPLRCAWCQNPECWRPEAELAFKARLCIGCGDCVEACPEDAREGPGGLPDAAACRRCFACADDCPSGALTLLGELRGVACLVEELAAEAPFHAGSGGGVTLSGGEPTVAAPFALQLARELRAAGTHVALETCGHFPADGEAVSALLAEVDLVLFDLKLHDDELAREHTGAPSSLIRANLADLATRSRNAAGPPVWPRLPIVPGITDAPGNLRSWAALLAEAKLETLTLVPFHRLGESKRAWLGQPAGYVPKEATEPALASARRMLEDAGIRCYAPGEEP